MRFPFFCAVCGERLPALKGHAIACPSCGGTLRASGRSREPLTAALLSLFVPGAGQVFNGQLFKGLIVFATCWLIVPWIFGVIDAWCSARRIDRTMNAPVVL